MKQGILLQGPSTPGAAGPRCAGQGACSANRWSPLSHRNSRLFAKAHGPDRSLIASPRCGSPRARAGGSAALAKLLNIDHRPGLRSNCRPSGPGCWPSMRWPWAAIWTLLERDGQAKGFVAGPVNPGAAGPRCAGPGRFLTNMGRYPLTLSPFSDNITSNAAFFTLSQ